MHLFYYSEQVIWEGHWILKWSKELSEITPHTFNSSSQCLTAMHNSQHRDHRKPFLYSLSPTDFCPLSVGLIPGWHNRADRSAQCSDSYTSKLHVSLFWEGCVSMEEQSQANCTHIRNVLLVSQCIRKEIQE